MRDVKQLMGTLDDELALSGAVITQVEKITLSEVNAAPNEIFVVESMIVSPTGAPDKTPIASISTDQAIISVSYHHGRQTWNLEIEHKAQKATEFRTMTLNNALKTFEECAGVTLPAIPVTEYGVGIYPAKHADADGTKLENPWELKPGVQYRAVGKLGQVREFVAVEDKDQIKIAFVTDQNGSFDENELFTPSLHLSEHEWEYLRKYEIPKHQGSRSRHGM